MGRSECEDSVRSRGWLSQQPAQFQDLILREARLVGFATGEYVFHSGDSAGGIYGIARGAFFVYVAGRSARMSLAHIVRPGVWFGHGPVLTQRLRTLTFRAAEPSHALHVPLAGLERIFATDPEGARRIGALSEHGMDIALGAIADLLIGESERRIAATLLRVAGIADDAEPPARIAFRLTQGELGEMANASRHLVNRTLARFEAQGWISVHYNRVTIIDSVALTALVREEA